MEITKEELSKLSNDEIRGFYLEEFDINNLPLPIRDYVNLGSDNLMMGVRINTVEKLLNEIVVERFVKREL